MSNKKSLKQLWKKTWYFIWEDDSVWSWIANIILAFVLIKFIVYPVLGFTLSTGYPIVAVVSGSMEHDGNFDEWWSSYAICGNERCTQKEFYADLGITREEFEEFPYKNGFNTGDIMILYGTKPNNFEVGDVLVFKSNRPDPIIHRIIRINKTSEKYIFMTKGDHNIRSIDNHMLDEVLIKEDQIIGKAVFRVPLLGYVKIGFVKLIELGIDIFRG